MKSKESIAWKNIQGQINYAVSSRLRTISKSEASSFVKDNLARKINSTHTSTNPDTIQSNKFYKIDPLFDKISLEVVKNVSKVETNTYADITVYETHQICGHVGFGSFSYKPNSSDVFPEMFVTKTFEQFTYHGLGTLRLITLNELAKKFTNKPLNSSSVILSVGSSKVWEKLVTNNLAEKLQNQKNLLFGAEVHYRFSE